jgi:uncharacterized protein
MSACNVKNSKFTLMYRALVRIVLVVATFTCISLTAAESDLRVVQAAKKNDSTVIKVLIQQKAPVNVREGDGSTALLWAAYYSNLEMARALLAAGADPKVGNRLGLTPLLQACELGYSPIVELLLKAGVDVNAASPAGLTPLMAAASAADVEPVKLLLASGAQVNAREPGQSQTALMFAAAEGNLQIVQALLKAGADPNAAAKVASLSRVKMGDQGRDWVIHATGGLTPLMFAAREGHTDVAKAIAESGADLNYANPDGITALMLATINDRIDLAAMLIEKGANPNDGSLYEAVQLHNRRTVETNSDATRPRLLHTNTLTPLDLISRMLAKGADPLRIATHTLYRPGAGGGGSGGIVNPTNETPFARALQSQDVATLSLLLTKKPNLNAPIDGGALPLVLAMGAGGGRGGFFGFGGPPAPYRFPSERTTTAAANLLIEAGADVNAVNGAGDAALHAVAQTGDTAMIQILADHGAKLDVKNRAGLTPLDLAMGKRAPGAEGPGRGGPPGRGGGPPRPQLEAIQLLRKLQGLPALAPGEMPAAPAGRGPGPQGN